MDKKLYERAEKIYNKRYPRNIIDKENNYVNSTNALGSTPTKPTGARLLMPLFERLEEISKSQKVSVNQIINKAVDEYISNYDNRNNEMEDEKAKWFKSFKKMANEEQERLLNQMLVDIIDLNL